MNSSIFNFQFSFFSQFRELALGVLEQCYRENDDKTWQLITYELKNWSDWTCLSLAVISHHQEFVAHKCCQMILNDLWMGGMSIRRYLNWKVVASILFFPLVLRIEFKSAEELKLQPKTHEEHLATQEANDPNDDDDDDDDDSDEYNSETVSNDYTHCGLSEDNLPKRPSKFHNNTSIDFVIENQNIHNESIEMIRLNKSTIDRTHSSSLTNLKQSLSISVPQTDDLIDINIETPKKSNELIKNLPKKTISSIPLTQRFYEFYNAPITKFWYNAIFYLLFLFLFTYMVLVRTPLRPSIAGKEFE
jgi:transient receptor potential cation channel subfamily M protein 3